MKAITVTVCIVIVLASLSTGCKSIPKEGVETTVVLAGNGDAPDSFVLSGPFGVKSFLAGSVVSSPDGRKTLTVESFRWFDNWHDGWTEARIAASGIVILEKKDDGWTVAPQERPVLEYVENATVRHRDTIIERDDGLRRFSWRYDRIAAVSGFLKTVLQDETPDPAAFRTEAGKYLFPEVYGHAVRRESRSEGKVDRVKAEGISWDTRYTADAFPAEFAEVRNTGTLYRDWVESADLFYVLYVWDQLSGFRAGNARVIEEK